MSKETFSKEQLNMLAQMPLNQTAGTRSFVNTINGTVEIANISEFLTIYQNGELQARHSVHYGYGTNMDTNDYSFMTLALNTTGTLVSFEECGQAGYSLKGAINNFTTNNNITLDNQSEVDNLPC